MSTYEYIVRLRDKHLRTNKSDVESGEISPPKIEPIKVGIYSNNGMLFLLHHFCESICVTSFAHYTKSPIISKF